MSHLKFTFTLLSFLIFKIALSQDFRIGGTLINQDDNLPLPGATVRLMNLRDTTKIKFTGSSTQGEFAFENLNRGPYKLIVTFLGFEKYTQTVMVNGKTENLGKISVKPASASLGEVNITGTAIRGEQKGDTTQYNADAFKVSKDATTEDLIKKMPGITIDNGTVKAHGEDVKKVLVDGKQFFGDDPSVTLKNLPAEVVDKIQVFDKLSDQAAWTGFDDGSGQKTINIITRNSKNSGQFGKFSAGYGTDDRYLLGANVNFFKGSRRITLLGMSNNVNQQNFSAEDVIGSGSGGRQQGMPGGRGGGPGMPSQFGPQSGIFTTQALGFNYTDAWGTKCNVNASYFLNAGNNTTDKLLTRQYIFGGTPNTFYNELSSSNTDNTNHRMNMRIEFNPDSLNSFILTPRLSLQVNNATSNAADTTASSKDFALANLLNRAANNNSSDANGYNFNNDLLYRHKFNKKGRTISVDFGTGITYRYKNNYVNTISDYYGATHGQTNDSVNQHGNTSSNGLSLSSNLVYTEPIGKNSQLQFNYNISWSENDNDKKTYNYVLAQQEYLLFDTLLSNIYKNDYITHRVGTGYLYQTPKMNLNAGLTYEYAYLKGNTTFHLNDSTKKSFNTVLPNFMLNYKFTKFTNLRMSYRISTNAPSTGQLQSVIDNSNPLLLSTGNPDLRQEIRHNGMTRFSHSNKEKTMNLFGMLFFQKTVDYIGYSTISPSAGDTNVVVNGQKIKPGSQITIPKNLEGAWNGRALFTIGFPFKPIKSNLNFNTGVSYNRLPSLINTNTNFSNTYGFNLGGVLSSNISDKLDFTFTYNVNYNLVDNTIQPNLNNNYFFQIGSVQFNWEFWKGFFFQNSVTYQNYSGISSKISDQYTLWNLNVGKKFLKNKAAEIKLSCYDLLNENKSLNRSVTDTYIEDSNTEVLKQYFMLSFTYNLRNFTGRIPGEGRPPDGERHGFDGRPDFHMH